MPQPANLLIFGASTRAAAFSTLRAGLNPWCADLFADADLQVRCPMVRVPGNAYPQGFLRLIDRELPGPWMYTGALENHRLLVEQMASIRELWGNGEGSLALARAPWYVASFLHEAGFPCPAWSRSAAELSAWGQWLVKPLAGAGGSGIHFRNSCPPGKRRLERAYYQEYIEGTPCAAVYVGDGSAARFLGATWQLVGADWLHAAPFRYCGSVGPLRLSEPLRHALEQLGNLLANGCQLRGLFGVDFILKDEVPWVIEINPRYTASIEVLEYATGVSALSLHRQVFDPDAPPVPDANGAATDTWLGKAILFASTTLTFPADGPWLSVMRAPAPLHEPPAFADVPWAGDRIDAGRPILTFFASADSAETCTERLRQIAADLDCWLFRR